MNNEDRLLRAEEVALYLGVSVPTLNNWYRFKRMYPESQYSKLLPDVTQSGPRQTRLWKMSDIWLLTQFKNAIPHGRNGILGDVTQAYAKHRKEK